MYQYASWAVPWISRVYPWQNSQYSPRSQIITYYKWCVQFLSSSGFILFYHQSLQFSAILCHLWTFLKLFTILSFRTGIYNATQVFKANPCGKGSTIVKDFMCRQSRSRWCSLYLSYFASAKPESFSGFCLPIKIQLCLYAHNYWERSQSVRTKKTSSMTLQIFMKMTTNISSLFSFSFDMVIINYQWWHLISWTIV